MPLTPNLDIDVNQKASFAMVLQLSDASGSSMDVSLWNFSGSIKQKFNDVDPITSFNITPLTTSSLKISLLPSQTAALTKPQYLYDIVALNVSPDPDEAYRLLEGKINVSLGVTGPIGP